MMRVEIVGIGKTVNLFKKIRKNLKKVPNELTLESARALHKRVKNNLQMLSGHPGGDNTPSLQRDLYFKSGSRGHFVGMSPNPGYGALADVVDKGRTGSWVQPFNLRIRYNKERHIHGPIKPSRFWSKAINDFKAQDRDKIVQKHADRLLR